MYLLNYLAINPCVFCLVKKMEDGVLHFFSQNNYYLARDKIVLILFTRSNNCSLKFNCNLDFDLVHLKPNQSPAVV